MNNKKVKDAIEKRKVYELKSIAKELGIPYSNLKIKKLRERILEKNGAKLKGLLGFRPIWKRWEIITPLILFILGSILIPIYLQNKSSDDTRKIIEEVINEKSLSTRIEIGGNNVLVVQQLPQEIESFILNSYGLTPEQFIKKVENFKNTSKKVYDKALIYFMEGKYQEAIWFLDQHLMSYPYDILALSYKGLALYSLNENEEALEYFDRVLNISDCCVPTTWYNKALALTKLSRFDEALQAFDRYMELDQYSTAALSNSALLAIMLGNYSRSLSYFHKGLSINPNDEYLLLNYGTTLANMKMYAESIKVFDKLTNLSKNEDVLKMAWNNKGISFFYLGQLEKSAESFNKALEIDPDFELAKKNKIRYSGKG